MNYGKQVATDKHETKHTTQAYISLKKMAEDILGNL